MTVRTESSDALHADTLDVTHDLLAQLLGTTRPGVSLAAVALVDRGVIRQRRGRLRILQRTGLRAVYVDRTAASTVSG
jgi:CRP-like cAMP-binding protein